MTSSTSELQSVMEEVRRSFGEFEVEKVDERQYRLILTPDKAVPALSFLKERGFSHLSLLTCVDWIDDGRLELVYILFNWTNGQTLLVSTFVDRNRPVFQTVKDLWPTAEYYERDVHEFFGVEFEGNENCNKPLFLELWNDLPPLRKDFDPLKFSKEHYPDREYQRDAIHEARIVRGEIRGEVDG